MLRVLIIACLNDDPLPAIHCVTTIFWGPSLHLFSRYFNANSANTETECAKASRTIEPKRVKGLRVSNLLLEAPGSDISCTIPWLDDFSAAAWVSMFAKAFAFLLLPALASAQAYGPPPGPASPTTATSSAAAVAPSAPPSTSTQVNIDVAPGGNLTFNPQSITVSPGTLVTFYFPSSPLNHSVTQSTFANPCTYLAANASTNAPGGFDSGLVSASTFTINVTDSNPIWYFCNHPLHCGLGMVGSINAPTTGSNTFSAFLAAATSIGSSEPSVADNGPVNGGVDATATGPPVSDLTTAAPAAPASGAIKVTTSIGFVLFAAILGISMA